MEIIGVCKFRCSELKRLWGIHEFWGYAPEYVSGFIKGTMQCVEESEIHEIDTRKKLEISFSGNSQFPHDLVAPVRKK